MDPSVPVSGAPTVMVSFYTNTYEKSVNEQQTFSVPKAITKNGLSEIVNKLMGHSDEESIPFDFLYENEFITIGLDKFLKTRPQINTDDTLALEFTPSVSMEDGNKIPHDDWVSAVSTPFLGEVIEEDIFVTGSYDRRLRLCIGSETIALGDGHKGAIKALKAVSYSKMTSANDEALKRKKRSIPAFVAVSSGKDCSVRVWRYSDGEGLTQVRGLTYLHRESIDCLDVSPNCELTVCGSWDKNLTLFKLKDALNPDIKEENLQTAVLAGHSRPVLSCKFFPDSLTILSSGQDGQCKVWDAATARFKQTYSGEYSVNSMATHATEEHLFLTGHSDNRARLWDTREKRSIKTFSGHLGWVYSVAWAPAGCASSNSHLFVTGAEDSVVNLYDIRAQRPLTTHTVHNDGVLDVAFVQKSTVVSVSKDATARSTVLTGYNIEE